MKTATSIAGIGTDCALEPVEVWPRQCGECAKITRRNGNFRKNGSGTSTSLMTARGSPKAAPASSNNADYHPLGVVDVDRQEAALVIMSVEQRELLMAVDDIAVIVDVERDGCRLARVAAGSAATIRLCPRRCGW